MTDSCLLLPRLSTILICEFTLDLRRRNETRSLPNLSALKLPDLNPTPRDNPIRSIQSVIGRLHETIIADMGEWDDSVDADGPGEEEPTQETA
ncbi:hypothetical protein Clacol_004349 [Clathrus columnatus]|uniref:Uncharacterized protein n=1 Tax=Clathrus columnatus TaxID=1419009 RepID=A0AAV5ABV9_9AGAM|nr:hypothetical protein Clacol_004349 [Clathrus columnatus]